MYGVNVCGRGQWSGPHPVSGQGLGAILVNDLDVSWGLYPRLPVHLHGHALITQDGDLHRTALTEHKDI